METLTSSEFLELLIQLAKNNPNDYELGKKIRKLLESIKKEEA
jgi:hypothetical protein